MTVLGPIADAGLGILCRRRSGLTHEEAQQTHSREPLTFYDNAIILSLGDSQTLHEAQEVLVQSAHLCRKLYIIAAGFVLGVGLFVATGQSHPAFADGCTPLHSTMETVGTGPTIYGCPLEFGCTFANVHRINWADSESETECETDARFVEVEVTLCPGYGAGTGVTKNLTAYDANMNVIDSWPLVASGTSANTFEATSDCYGEACFPVFWGVSFSNQACIYSIEWFTGCCYCTINDDLCP